MTWLGTMDRKTGSAGNIIAVALLAIGLTLCAAGCALHTTSRSLEIGMKTPDFELEDHEGKRWSLTEMRADGPAVVLFYRGYW